MRFKQTKNGNWVSVDENASVIDNPIKPIIIKGDESSIIPKKREKVEVKPAEFFKDE